MSSIDDSRAAFQQGAAQFFALLTPEQTRKLAELQGDPSIIQRLEELAEKANEGELNDAERAQYEGYIEANQLLAVLQAEARHRLSPRKP